MEIKNTDLNNNKTNEIISAGLFALECQNELKLEKLRLEIQKGIDAYKKGEYITLNSEQELELFFDELEAEIQLSESK